MNDIPLLPRTRTQHGGSTLVLNNAMYLPPQGFPDAEQLLVDEIITPRAPPNTPMPAMPPLPTLSPTAAKPAAANRLNIDFSRALQLKGLKNRKSLVDDLQPAAIQTPKQRGLKRAAGGCGFECSGSETTDVCALQ